MKIRTLLLILFILLVAGFVALNFAQILQPTALNFGLTEVQAPLGLVLLSMLVLVLVVFLAALVYQQTTHMMEVRRVTREASEQRTLADKAEASRFTELRTFLQAEMQATAAREIELAEKLHQKVDRLQVAMTEVIEQNSNGLSASLGELEDRLERQFQPREDRS
ncbi:LapA family protein [Hydrogenophaga sp. PBL-H3]|uniref:LapA family protein n=1 Tax=Hydrogenophaga sp. PBL-H3 TaxID=434010 RepID=UPI00132018EB|nr:LapA family protein [Hydrogenophaga sp. PBL-H3]QHE77562.1 LapA family protein [Hydrogenophaga sp. PBL-H3]QHE81986.1 LapA family protein [Hydrogenophaga sp. PBL-H3]